MTLFYNIIFLLFSAVYLPYLLLTGRYHKDFKQRFGVFPEEALREVRGKEVVWLHAVSVGEVMATRSFCEGFLNKYPSKRLVISTVTKTGNDVAKKIFGGRTTVIYLPLDLSWVVNRVMEKFAPRVFVMVETEIWPNLINCLSRRKVPVIMINGRISPRSFKNYMKVRFIMRPIVEKITLFCMQNRDYAERIKSIGASPERIAVTGNMKFDAARGTLKQTNADSVRRELNLGSAERVFIAGSTHPGEDEIILDVYKELKKDFKNLRLIIAPRHIERVTDIENLVKKNSFTPLRISQPIRYPLSAKGSDNSVFILDTMGRLGEFYSIANLVFIGGSLIRKGGQNLLEPAVLGKSIVFGPYMFNFSDITEFFLSRKAACMVRNKKELLDVSRDILSIRNLREDLAMKAKEAVKENLGASQRNLEKLERYV